MRIRAVFVSGNPKNDLARKTARKAVALLEKKKIKVIIDRRFLHSGHSGQVEKAGADAAIVFGGDGAMLHFLRELGKKKLPVLGINCGGKGMIMQAGHGKLEAVISMLAAGNFSTEKKQRILPVVDGKQLKPALNDVMISPKKPAVLMRYDLFVDGKFFFRAISDAVLVSSATGSTAYAVSGANLIAHEKAKVLIIRPVNSPSHPQIVILDENSEIRVENIDCQLETEAIIDGQERMPVKKGLSLQKARQPAVFIRLQKETLAEKEHLHIAMPSAKYVYWALKEKGSMTQNEIIRETGLNWRTAKRALDFLVKHEIIVREPLFHNRKQKIYSIR